MHINIVSKYNSFAMHILTEPLKLMPGFEVTVTDAHDAKADLNYHVPCHFIMEEGGDAGLNAILYTHTNPNAELATASACEKADLIMCMSYTGREELLALGVDPAKIWVACAGNDTFAAQRFNVGIVGSLQPNGRKRPSALLDIYYALPNHLKNIINFVVIGNDWEVYTDQLEAAGASVINAQAVEHKHIQQFYHQLDALLIPSYIEGGPLPLLEALRCGIPVLSSRVGYGADVLKEEDLFDTPDEAAQRIAAMMQPKFDRMMLGTLFPWRDWISAHAGAFSRFLGVEMAADEIHGIGRYNQLIELIAEHKPQSICEIGTWSGLRACEMIQEAQKHNESISYLGFDLFEEQTAAQIVSEVSKRAFPSNIVERRIAATRANVRLVAGNTRETLSGFSLYERAADFYFIDGGHSEETIASDWGNVEKYMKPNAVVVFDDYYHAGGNPDGAGCNAIIDSLDPNKYTIEHLPFVTETNNSGQMLRVSMVKVTKNKNYSWFDENGVEYMINA